MTINGLLTSKPFVPYFENAISDQCYVLTDRGNFSNVAFGKRRVNDLSLFQVYAPKIQTRKYLIKALHDSSKNSDANASSDKGRLFDPVGEDKVLQRDKNGGFTASNELSKSLSDYADMSEINVSKFFHRHNILEGPDTDCTALTSQFFEKLSVNENGFLVEVLDKLEAVRLHALALEQWNAPRLKECHRVYHLSAKNLIHYVSLRTIDINRLQDSLSFLGLSNLEGSNAHIMTTLESIINILNRLTQQLPKAKVSYQGHNLLDDSRGVQQQSNLQNSSLPPLQNHDGQTLLEIKRHAYRNVELLLGPYPSVRKTHIMVTVGTEAATDSCFVDSLIKSGVNILRINCAHDSPDIWKKIIKNVRESSQMQEKPCRVLMDLAGPKLRTGPFEQGPKLRKIRPLKDAKGVTNAPAPIWIAPPDVNPPTHICVDAVIPVNDEQWIRNLESGDLLMFSDARGKKKSFKIIEKFSLPSGIGCYAECYKTTYIESGTELRVKRKKSIGIGRVGDLPVTQQFIWLKRGDLLVITRDSSLTSPSTSRNAISGPAKVTCSAGLLFDSVKPGEPVEFDDGKIRGTIRGVNTSEICVEITHAGQKGSKLGPEKSINVPKSKLHFEGLTVKDLMDLDFIGANADMVGVSFVNNVNDVSMLQQQLGKRDLKKLGIVLKIETKSGFESLPLLLLQAMKTENPLGVMIARGDLAIECGWEKLAEMQEEILSICEAAHIPCIWATQVLENLAKSGLPTRAEITDAAVGSRADCVMLNKGKHVIEAVETLDSILKSSSRQQFRMKPVLKPLLFSTLF